MTQTLLATVHPKQANSLSFVWWNVADFYHFDGKKVAKNSGSRWPQSLGAYNEKCERVDAALRSMFMQYGTPSILSLGEVTRHAAEDLRNRLLPNHNLISLDVKSDEPTLQVAILYPKNSPGIQFVEQPPITVPSTPRGTRPMAVIDIVTKKDRLRCVICHWQARLDEGSQDVRLKIGSYLSEYAYTFLKKTTKRMNNIVILGDLNEEPYELPLKTLHAHRHRERAKTPSHWTDCDVKRAHLYNCSWRLLGEKHPHAASASGNQLNVAGTYYWKDKHSWHNLDHIIVSGGLLGNTPPYLDESNIDIVSLGEFMPEGAPEKFRDKCGKYSGLSDHLPIIAVIKN